MATTLSLQNGFTQQRLAMILVADTGEPLRRIPVYAEIVLKIQQNDAETVISDNPVSGLAELVNRLSLERLDNFPTVKKQLKNYLKTRVDLARLSNMRDGPDKGILLDLQSAADTVIKDIIDDDSWLDEPPRNNWKLKLSIAVNSALKSTEIPKLPDTKVIKAQSITRRIPLGVLASDQAGYLSFDLSKAKLPRLSSASESENRNLTFVPSHTAAANRLTSLSFFVYPGLIETNRVDVLNEARMSPDVILSKIELDPAKFKKIQNLGLGLPAMQSPSLIDWRLSPGSFAAIPQTLIGADGCETLTPANFAISSFDVRQVIRIAPAPGAEANTPPQAYINEFQIQLIPMGHSLGSILYSLPLAPGESVRLAVVDWRRSDEGQRTEQTTVTESLVHDQSHDRAITETVSAALSELQKGGSIMGGMAAGAGGSYGAGSMGLAGGAMSSIGGAYSTSEGSRKLTAATTQKIADAVHQSSNSVRELYSSVVVQADQKESESINTRTFFNNNRGHTMTVLYYEILRHFRVVSKFSRRYPAALVKRKDWNVSTDEAILKRRYILEPALRDQSLKPGFDALQRLETIRVDRLRLSNDPTAVPSEGRWPFTQFRVEVNMSGFKSKDAVGFRVKLKNTRTQDPFSDIITLKLGGNDVTNWNRNQDFNRETNFKLTSDYVDPPIHWHEIIQFQFHKDDGDDVIAPHTIEFFGISPFGEPQLYKHIPATSYRIKSSAGFDGDTIVMPVIQPKPPPFVKAPESELSPDEFAVVYRLRRHVHDERIYYSRILDLARHPDEYAYEFETLPYGTAGVYIDHVSPTPVEILGSNIVFPLLDSSIDDIGQPIPDEERIISLPTRGVFAEAKLGHCNVAEEIDDTRFWRWDEHPNPMVATEIKPIEHKQAEVKDVGKELAPSQFPANIVNIQQPTALPDPTGLAAALTAITTPNIFRDMSGRAEVQALLHDLINGAVSMADAANRARSIQSGQKASSESGGGNSGSGTGGAEQSTSPEIAKARAEDDRKEQHTVTPKHAAEAIKMTERQVQKGNLSEEKGKEIIDTQLSNIRGSTKPKEVKPTIKKLLFNVILRGQNNRTLSGRWKYSLSQAQYVMGENKDYEDFPSGAFTVTAWYEPTVTGAFSIDVSGFTYGVTPGTVGVFMETKLLDFTVPAELLKSQDYFFVTLKADTTTTEVTAKSEAEAMEEFKKTTKTEDGVEIELGPFFVSISKAKEEASGDSHTSGHGSERKWNVEYYTGYFNWGGVR